MEYRFMGKTGLKVSELCFGPGNNNVTDDRGGMEMLEAAFDMGITIYDTSNVEKGGSVEGWLGKVFADRRDEVVIASKYTGDATRKQIMRECEGSLKRLNTDYIDIYRSHYWQPTVAIEESLEALTALVQQGKILYAGCCGFKAYQIANSLRASERHGYTKLAVVGARYSLLGQDGVARMRYPLMEVQEFDLIPFMEEEQLGFIPFMTLAGGLLTGKYRPGEPPPAGSRFAGPPHGSSDFIEKARPVLEVVDKLRPLAERRGETLAQFAIAWTLSRPVVSSILVGANTVDQLKVLVDAAGRTLIDEELREVDEIRSVLPGCVTEPSGVEKRWREWGWRQV